MSKPTKKGSIAQSTPAPVSLRERTRQKRGFRIERNRGPELFAGAGGVPPDNPRSNPAYYERVPLIEVTEATLARGIIYHDQLYMEAGRFDIAEAGTYRGRGLRAILELSERMGVEVHVTGLDSFEGLPPLSDIDLEAAPDNAAYVRRTLFADVTEREVRAYIGVENSERFTLVKGFFEDTLPTLEERNYLMAIIDCDLYSSHMDCMAYFYDRLLPGGVMFFDDYHSSQYPMAKSAVDEFLVGKPEKLMHIGYAAPKGNNMKTYIIKS